MKIVIVGPAHPLRGGIADTNESLCRSLVQEGHDASIISFTLQYPGLFFPGKTQFSTEKKPEDIAITPVINSINPLTWIRAARKINRMKPDLVIVRYWIPFLAPCLGSIARRLNRQIVLIALCDNVIPHEKRMGDTYLTRYFTQAFHGFITMSKTTLRELDSFTKKPKRYYPHPINSHLGNKVGQAIAREHLHLSNTEKYLLFFGLIRDYKGLDLTLRALAEPILKDLNIRLLIVGEFYDPIEKYNELINDLGLKENIEITNQFIPMAEIKYYFSAADLVIQTYKTASQSGVSQIAYNFECPILVTDVGGLSEVVIHGKVGYVCQKDPKEIASAVKDYFINHRRENFSQNMQREKYKYSWNSFCVQILELYREIV